VRGNKGAAPTVKLTPRTEKKRLHTLKKTEKVKFVKIAISLLKQALQTNFKLDGGGSAFKETLDHARDAAGDASEPALKMAVDKALALFKDNKDGRNSKELIEDILGGGVGSRVQTRKDINVFVNCGGEKFEREEGDASETKEVEEEEVEADEDDPEGGEIGRRTRGAKR